MWSPSHTHCACNLDHQKQPKPPTTLAPSTTVVCGFTHSGSHTYMYTIINATVVNTHSWDRTKRLTRAYYTYISICKTSRTYQRHSRRPAHICQPHTCRVIIQASMALESRQHARILYATQLDKVFGSGFSLNSACTMRCWLQFSLFQKRKSHQMYCFYFYWKDDINMIYGIYINDWYNNNILRKLRNI